MKLIELINEAENLLKKYNVTDLSLKVGVEYWNFVHREVPGKLKFSIALTATRCIFYGSSIYPDWLLILMDDFLFNHTATNGGESDIEIDESMMAAPEAKEATPKREAMHIDHPEAF